MELTLRAAHKLVEKISGHIKTIEVTPLVTVNTFEVENPEALFNKFAKLFAENIERVASLTALRSYLRNEIGAKNTVEIDALIGQRKFLIERLAMYQRVLEVAKQEGQLTTPAALTRKIASLNASKVESIYARNDTVTFSIITPETKSSFEDLVAGMRRAVEQIEDKLLHLNISNKVALTDVQVETLRAERLI